MYSVGLIIGSQNHNLKESFMSALKYRFIITTLSLILILSCISTGTIGRYVLTNEGRELLGAAFFTTKVTTGTFVVFDEDIGSDGSGIATSGNKFGLSMDPVDKNGDGIQDVDGEGNPLYFVDGTDYTKYKVEELNGDILFTVQNDTDHTLIVMFDITLLLGQGNPKLTTTIAEETSKVGLTLVLYRNSYSGNLPNQQLKEAGNVTTDLENNILWQTYQYSAFTAQVNPANFIGNGIDLNDLTAFLLIDPGETKSYTLSVEYGNEGWWDSLVGALDKACYAQITMSATRYTGPTP